MTILLDIAALAALLLVLTFIPALALRQEARITRQLRRARLSAADDTAPGEPAAPPPLPGAAETPQAAEKPAPPFRAVHPGHNM
ncbi:hypothetical protein [Actinacidiphila sp. ITFR-21]|uniref:hypothetical protein n=1 Tax=Actinacidiphila sp. ITFR-21 TaxID=3075199 RepID=UPI002889F069|nr:hypothetical protein [Streptomyces sp. ITFR-21]WNI17921.1 hypothetical protein RLT57_21830 [Streptomyces sp. ITFR-21]